jgi:hypothetical protein
MLVPLSSSPLSELPLPTDTNWLLGIVTRHYGLAVWIDTHLTDMAIWAIAIHSGHAVGMTAWITNHGS